MASEQESPQSLPIRLIVVEDNFSVADSLRFVLDSHGFDVVGMAGRVETALDLVATTPFDLAVLDIDLHGEIVTPVADAVRALSKPIVFVTGYNDEALLPQHLAELVRLEKPIDADQLANVILEIVAGPSVN